MEDGFHTTGEILLITGVGGSLGAVIEATGLDSVLGDLFQADEGAPVILSILLAWFIAAVLHLAIGSVSVAAITAAGIIAPILDSLTVSPIVIGLAIASGAMFALQVNSNFFWMFKSLLGLSTKGTLEDPDAGDLGGLRRVAATRHAGGDHRLTRAPRLRCMRLFLLRHGQTHGNVSGALDTAFPGLDLTDLGSTTGTRRPRAR